MIGKIKEQEKKNKIPTHTNGEMTVETMVVVDGVAAGNNGSGLITSHSLSLNYADCRSLSWSVWIEREGGGVE